MKKFNGHAEVIEEFSKYFSRNVDYMKNRFVSNGVTAEIAMSTNK